MFISFTEFIINLFLFQYIYIIGLLLSRELKSIFSKMIFFVDRFYFICEV
jgi:hypothetical protein